MDIYQTLANDHEQVKLLLDELENAFETDANPEVLLDSLRDLLIPHSRAEEAVFYNALRSIPGVDESIKDSYADHMKAETVLHMLRGLEKVNIEWEKAARKLKEDLLDHIQREESIVFPQARQVLLEEESIQMASAFEQLKLKAKTQGDFKNSVDLIGNMMPARFKDLFKRDQARAS